MQAAVVLERYCQRFEEPAKQFPVIRREGLAGRGDHHKDAERIPARMKRACQQVNLEAGGQDGPQPRSLFVGRGIDHLVGSEPLRKFLPGGGRQRGRARSGGEAAAAGSAREGLDGPALRVGAKDDDRPQWQVVGHRPGHGGRRGLDFDVAADLSPHSRQEVALGKRIPGHRCFAHR